MVNNGKKKMVKNGQIRSKMAKYSKKGSNMVKNGQKRSKLSKRVKNGQQRSKTLKNGQRLYFLYFL